MQNQDIRAQFSALPAPVVFEPGKVGKIWSKHFSTAVTENYKNCTPNSVGPARVVSGPKKVTKIRTKHFSAVLMGNNRNCTQKSLGMFWLQNRVIWVWFSTLPSSVVFRPEKVAKIRSKHFLAAVTRNYKNCTPNNVGSAPMLSSLAKVVKIRLYNFKSYRREMIRTAPQIVWVWLWYKTKSSRPSFQLSLLGACSGGVRARKFCKNLTEIFLVVLAENDKNCTSNSVGMSRVQNWVIRALFPTLLTSVVSGLGKVVKIRPKHFFRCNGEKW